MRSNDEWATYIHNWAVNKGWWQEGEDRNLPELLALMHSELDEAYEEWLNGHSYMEIYYNPEAPTKPEGFPVEMADCWIRCADLLGLWHLNPSYVAIIARPKYKKVAGVVGECHIALSSALEGWRHHASEDKIAEWIRTCMVAIERWAETQHLNLDDLLELKMAYNEKREYRHGGLRG